MSERKEKIELDGKGEVFSFTTVTEAPEGFEGLAPYHIAMIKLAEGPMVTAQLTDLHYKWENFIDKDGNKRKRRIYEVEIGMPVEMVTRKLRDNSDETGIIVYGYKFRPLVT